MCRGALAAGFLTGKYWSESDISKSPRGSGVKKYLDARGQRVLTALDETARRRDATPAQVAIAWLIARASITAPIASATDFDQLDELVRGATLALDREAINSLDAAGAPSP